MSLSKRLEQAIEMSGMSRNQFAHKCGVAQPRLFAIIHEKTKSPQVDTIIKIAEGAGVSLNWLAMGKGPMYQGGMKVDEAAEMIYHLQKIGGPLTEKELTILKMLRRISKNDVEGFRAIVDQITHLYVALE